MRQGLLLLVLGLIVAGIGVFYFSGSLTAEETQEEVVQVQPLSDVAIAKALEPRILGNPDAPIKISEHSSFSCGHCGHFHRGSMAGVKEQLIDTGKAYIVFSDFPLNAPALHASMVARCVPHERYFDFVETLFARQNDWAYERNYFPLLQDMAAEYGLDEAGFKSCLASDALQEGILAGVKAAQAQWEVQSTPSFVVNNKTLLSGVMSPDDFVTKVNEAVSGPDEADQESPAE